MENPRSSFKIYIWFLVFLIFLTIFRLSLTNNGHLYWPDEGRYTHALSAVHHLEQKQLTQTIKDIFSGDPHPGYYILSMLPTMCQFQAMKWHWTNPFSPHFFDIPSIFNAMITLMISFLFFLILTTLTQKPWLAICGTVIYSVLINTNLYIRHLLPYDAALCIFLFALFFIIKKKEVSRLNATTAIMTGILSAYGFITYSGYYVFVCILAVTIFTCSQKKILMTSLHLLSAGITLCMVNSISNLAGVSFFENNHNLSTTISQGSFEEGYRFIFQYLIEIEGLIGGMLVLLFLIYVIGYLRKEKIFTQAILFSALGGYLFHATMSVYGHRFVFYGRLLHMYIPFLVLGAILLINRIKTQKLQQGAVIILLGLSAISCVRYMPRYAKLRYPRDLILTELTKFKGQDICYITEITGQGKCTGSQPKIIAINFTHLFPIPEKQRSIDIPKEMSLAKEWDHPLNFKAYSFEGFNIGERRLLEKRKYQMKIYIH